MKKRTILVIALVLAFALSLSAVSNATQIHKNTQEGDAVREKA